jgi:hypothetical protein
MKLTATFAAAAASILALAGCADMQAQPAATAKTASAGTYYCWRERLNDLGPNLVCNWDPSPSAACSAKDDVSLPKANVADVPKRTHRCENGQWLVMVNVR